ncbi:FtsX-like permease family protein [Streptomyces sporangiiformans]|uniref:ABC transporter permease n=1 Tax=Streptomyces sporangiiformans TaxID=2315329 RepID=A0A505DDL7_9ACTN|nr:FtsX-like permease family protein [Streptomyces sporangiiformans]TPQ15839.1 ABC transporter permease [Streptomyces sporangiiformans]
MIKDLRLAWLLTRGSDRREWWRVMLTAVGAALATGFGFAAIAVASVRGQVSTPYLHGLLNQPGQRAGVVVALLLLWVPVLGFLGQCARIGAVHRDRRLAGLRLAGATPKQVRRIASLESGLACLLGSAVAAVFSALLLVSAWQRPPLLVWGGFAVVALTVPLLAVLVSVVALRRVVASPLGWVRRVRPGHGRAATLALVVPAVLVGLAALLIVMRNTGPGATAFPLLVFSAVVLTGAGSVAVAGITARTIGRRLAARTENPAVLLAAERLQADPWATARTNAAVLLVAVVGVGFMGVRQIFLDGVHHPREGLPHSPEDVAFYTTGVNLAGAAVLVALMISLGGLAVGTAESLATRRRGLAAQAAAGVPQEVLGRALLLETALPLAPAMVLAGIGGTAVYIAYGLMTEVTIPLLLPLLVPVAVYVSCLLAAATSLPLLRRTVRPAELRYT